MVLAVFVHTVAGTCSPDRLHFGVPVRLAVERPPWGPSWDG